MKRSTKILIFAAPLVALIVAAKLTNTSPPTNVAETAPDAEPALQTRIYRTTFKNVEDAARSVILSQKTYGKNWTLLFNERADDTMTIKRIDAEVPVIVFTDDLTVTLEAMDEGTRVDVISKSRVGKGDFGENRRHVIQFLSALDEEVGKSSK